MKKILTIALALSMVLAVSTTQAKEKNISPEKKYLKEFYSNYSRWSLGVNGGVSAIWGDFNSFGADKTYIGFLGGLQLGYQISPTIGLSLSGSYGMNKLGHKSDNADYWMSAEGLTEYSYAGTSAPGYQQYQDLYVKSNNWLVNLNVDINLNNLFCGNKGNDRRWTFLLSPGVYGLYADPKAYEIANDDLFAEQKMQQKWNIGAGGDLSVVFKASKVVDVKLKCTGVWIYSPEVNDLPMASKRNIDLFASAQLGVAFKFGAKSKVDHLMYAPTRKYAKYEEPVPVVVVKEYVPVPVVEEVIIVEEVVPVVEKTVEAKPVKLPVLPTVHFVRGSSVIDETLYATQLEGIVSALKSMPDVKVNVYGYADHTGTEAVNDRISHDRADAVKAYLVKKGIAESRFVNVKGMGVDEKLTGDAGFSIEARRVEVIQN